MIIQPNEFVYIYIYILLFIKIPMIYDRVKGESYSESYKKQHSTISALLFVRGNINLNFVLLLLLIANCRRDRFYITLTFTSEFWRQKSHRLFNNNPKWPRLIVNGCLAGVSFKWVYIDVLALTLGLIGQFEDVLSRGCTCPTPNSLLFLTYLIIVTCNEY